MPVVVYVHIPVDVIAYCDHFIRTGETAYDGLTVIRQLIPGDIRKSGFVRNGGDHIGSTQYGGAAPAIESSDPWVMNLQ